MRGEEAFFVERGFAHSLNTDEDDSFHTPSIPVVQRLADDLRKE
jgi:hypothetical protein